MLLCSRIAFLRTLKHCGILLTRMVKLKKIIYPLLGFILLREITLKISQNIQELDNIKMNKNIKNLMKAIDNINSHIDDYLCTESCYSEDPEKFAVELHLIQLNYWNVTFIGIPIFTDKDEKVICKSVEECEKAIKEKIKEIILALNVIMSENNLTF